MGDYMKEASFSLAEAKFAMGDFNHLVLQNVSKAQLKVKLKKDNVAGYLQLLPLIYTCDCFHMVTFNSYINFLSF